jgi:hypothetical protein
MDCEGESWWKELVNLKWPGRIASPSTVFYPKVSCSEEELQELRK